MKKINLILISLIVLFAFGCTLQNIDTTMENKIEDTNKEIDTESITKTETKTDTTKVEKKQDLVNFKCIISNTNTYYFYENKSKFERLQNEGWVYPDGYYVKVSLPPNEYLIKYPIEESPVSFDNMIDMLEISKDIDTHICEKGNVTEEDVNLPDLEIISPSELLSKMG